MMMRTTEQSGHAPVRSLVIFGCGFAGSAMARLAKEAGYHVAATVRSAERVSALRSLGVEVHPLATLGRDDIQALVSDGAHVIVSFPPDGATDAAVASALAGASSIVYISTTSVYGAMRGEVEETTPVDATDSAARRRLAAEAEYLPLGATVLRAAGIYGPGRGLHLRIRDPAFRVRGTGAGIVSRVHVEDLARIALRAGIGTVPVERPCGQPPECDQGGRSAMPLSRQEARTSPAEGPSAPMLPTGPGRIFVVGDDCPAPQVDAVRWLCARLGLPMPARDTDDVSDHFGAPHRASRAADRAVRNHRVKQALQLILRYPSYREGFEACLRAESDSAPPGALGPRK